MDICTLGNPTLDKCTLTTFTWVTLLLVRIVIRQVPFATKIVYVQPKNLPNFKIFYIDCVCSVCNILYVC